MKNMNEKLIDELRKLVGDKKYLCVIDGENDEEAISVLMNGSIRDLVFLHKLVDIALNQRIEKAKE